MAQTRWQDIFNFLKSKGFNIFSPAMKTGECTEKYLVLQYGGGEKYTTFSSTKDTYTIMCFVPKNNYSELEVYKNKVMEAMKGMFPMIVPTYSVSTPYYDDTIKAHMLTIDYTNNKKITR